MKLIVGLGNPGRDYVHTRHNAGWMALDRLCARHAPGAPVRARFHADTVEAALPGGNAMLSKPTTYMNRSGVSVAEAVRFYKLDPGCDLLVITDDVALRVGVIRLRPGGGAGGHNGLRDIESRLGTADYPRLRIGVGAPHPGEDQASYVLGRFREDERDAVERAIDRAADAAEVFCREGLDAAMNRFNEKNAAPPPSPGTDPGWVAP